MMKYGVKAPITMNTDDSENDPNDPKEIGKLRNQETKEHPLLAAQNILTGAGKPIMSPSQQRQAAEDMKYLRTSLKKSKKKEVQSFTNEAFILEKSYNSVDL